MPQKTLITSSSEIGRQILSVVGAGLDSAGLRREEGDYLLNIGNRLKTEGRALFERLAVGVPASCEAARKAMGADFFGVEEWNEHYGITFTKGQLAKISQFPWNEKVLTAPCPFHSGKLIRDTHFAFLGVEYLDKKRQKPLTMLGWQGLCPASGQPRFYSYGSDCWYFKEKFAIGPTCQLRWYLMLKEIVPGSENKMWDEQQLMLPPEYEAPFGVEEVSKDLLCFKKTGVYLNPTRYGRVKDVSSHGHCVDVGGCDAEGLGVDSYWDGHRNGYVGLAAARKIAA